MSIKALGITAFLLIVIAIAGLLAHKTMQSSGSGVGTFSGTSQPLEAEPRTATVQKKVPSRQIVEPSQVVIDREEADDLHQEITELQKQHAERSAQIDALMRSTNTTLRVPDLPQLPAVLDAPVDLSSHQQKTDHVDLGSGFSLPSKVMNEVSQETGLTQQDIEEAMRQ